MSNSRLKLNSKGKLIVCRGMKKEKNINVNKTGDTRLDRYVDLINDENYMQKAIIGVADKLIVKGLL